MSSSGADSQHWRVLLHPPSQQRGLLGGGKTYICINQQGVKQLTVVTVRDSHWVGKNDWCTFRIEKNYSNKKWGSSSCLCPHRQLDLTVSVNIQLGFSVTAFIVCGGGRFELNTNAVDSRTWWINVTAAQVQQMMLKSPVKTGLQVKTNSSQTDIL